MQRTDRRTFLRSVAAAGAGMATVGTAAASSGASEISLYEDFGFYSTVDGWEKDADVPAYDGEPIDFSIEHTNRGTASGWWGGCVKYFLSGKGDDGAAWLQKEIQAEPNTTYDVDVSVAGYNEFESYNKLTNAFVYLGTKDPEVQDDFGLNDATATNAAATHDDLQQADREWLTYDASDEVVTGDDGTVYLAFGTSIIYERDTSNRLDDIALRMTPK